MVSHARSTEDYDRLKRLTYALFRSNVDWEKESQTCGDPECNGDCEYIATIREIVREVDGGELPGPPLSKLDETALEAAR